MLWLIVAYFLTGFCLGVWMAEYYWWTIRFRPPIDKYDYGAMALIVTLMVFVWPYILIPALFDRIKGHHG